MFKLKIKKIGHSVGIILPKDVLGRLGVHEGDELLLIETPVGYEVTRYDPQFADQLESAQKGMSAYKNTLRDLAK